MGCSCHPESKPPTPKWEVIQQDWANAVNTNNFTGILGLYQDDPDRINSPIDANGTRAIHIAVKKKNYILLDYLLKDNNLNINIKGGSNNNTALHEAVLINDFKTVSKLFSKGANGTLTNKSMKTPIHLCGNKYHKRQYLKSKEIGKKRIQINSTIDIKPIIYKKQSTFYFRGATTVNEIKQRVKESDTQCILLKNKEFEINQRKVPITEFGADCGIDCDEIGLYLQKKNHKQLEKIWEQLVQPNNCKLITKINSLYKLLYGITQKILKEKYPKKCKSPKIKTIQNLALKICAKYTSKTTPNKNKIKIKKSNFVEDHFYQYLYQIHDQFVAEIST